MSQFHPVQDSLVNVNPATRFQTLDGKLAIVTGASRGIGAAICRNLAQKGCSLVMNFTSLSSLQRTEELAKSLREEFGIKVVIVQADLGSENGPANVVKVAKNHFQHEESGKFRIDIIVNNAGVAANRTIEKADSLDFAHQYNVNVRGPLFLLRAALPYLPSDRSGRIINLSSVSSSLGFVGQSVYGGTKAALEAMTRTWARELSERATVNAVNPGPVDTDMYHGAIPEFRDRMTPFIKSSPLMVARQGLDPPEVIEAAKEDGGRMAYDFEIAGVVGMLCSEESAWCTGSVICANGGMRFSM